MSTQLYLALTTRSIFTDGPAEQRKAIFTHNPDANIREEAHVALFNAGGLWFVDTYDMHIYQLKEIQSWRVSVNKGELAEAAQ